MKKIILSCLLILPFLVFGKSIPSTYYLTAPNCKVKPKWVEEKPDANKKIFSEAEYVKIHEGFSVNIQSSSCSGDWTMSENYLYYFSGKIQNYVKEYSTVYTSHENGIRVREVYAYDEKGAIKKEYVKIFDLKTDVQILNHNDISFKTPESKVIKSIQELPFKK